MGQDGCGLVELHMRSQPCLFSLEKIRHCLEVSFHCSDINEKSRSVNLVFRETSFVFVSVHTFDPYFLYNRQ